ncbi:FecR family protein [Sphingobacterium sp. SYP-B4668]|uniref:FecR family protein n=1 Tax=Sphingobacterium sp. SYP-B4668 TaxID=2996035 RepID=UPI0022DD3D9B|nr:FecR family protein [Sphingobacterium sp. SYP-B4668]
MTYKPKSERLKYLADKWLKGTISTEEKIEFDEWYLSYEDHLVEDYTAENLETIEVDLYKQIQSLAGMDQAKQLSRIHRFKKICYWAASILVIVGISTFFYTRQKTEINTAEIAAIMPGSDKGNLRLGDQQAYDLEKLKNGILENRGGVEIVKTKEGAISYILKGNVDMDSKDIIESSVSTPNGGQYQIQLSDGTRIWLNAASEVKFPIAFVQGQRVVELQGEAYFEVAKDAKRPFIVKTATEEVKVLGTHFNVNAYREEAISRVSLLEGKVEVSAQHGSYKTLLSPGQQTVNGLTGMQVESFNPEESIAWKNGDFVFNNETLEQVMIRVGRWYDVQVQVDPKIANIQIWASISKSEQIDKVLRLVKLASEDITYRIEGRRVYMMPK